MLNKAIPVFIISHLAKVFSQNRTKSTKKISNMISQVHILDFEGGTVVFFFFCYNQNFKVDPKCKMNRNPNINMSK